MVFRVFNVEFGVKLIITTFYNLDEFHTQHHMSNCEVLFRYIPKERVSRLTVPDHLHETFSTTRT